MENSRKTAKRIGSRAAKKLLLRLSGLVRTAILGGASVLCLLNTGRLHLAYAVDSDGDLIAYVSSPAELDAVVYDVQRSVSSALGYWWDAPELKTYVSLATPGEAECDADAVADWLYDSVSDLDTLELVYVDGKAVCAFRTAAEVSEALRYIADRQVRGDEETVGFVETITVASGKAELSMLEGNVDALEAAVTVETTRRVTAEKTLNFESRQIVDSELYEDESYVRTYGREGLLTTEYLVTSRDGEIAAYTELSQTRREPVTQVIVLGTKVRLSTGSYIWPVESAWISSSFGWRNSSVGSHNHQGIDLANDYGTSILAADGGRVTFSGTKGGYGKLVIIEHDNGDLTYYAHCKKLLVSVGDCVKQGDAVALMGSTGTSTGCHLHFEIHPGGGKAVNPTTVLPVCDFPYLDW